MSDPTEDGTDHDTDHDDPRLADVDGDAGMPGELIDTPHNMPGDQPEDDRGPSKAELEGTD